MQNTYNLTRQEALEKLRKYGIEGPLDEKLCFFEILNSLETCVPKH